MFAKNVGQTDRMIRGVIGVLLLIAFFMTTGGWTWLLLVAGGVLVATAALGTCPPYALLGINTCKKS